jgi:hypothetical protein
MTGSNRPLWTTKNYELVAGASKDGESEYHIVNRTTGVVEIVGPQLPAALLAMHSIQQELDVVAADPAAELKRRQKLYSANPMDAFMSQMAQANGDMQ